MNRLSTFSSIYIVVGEISTFNKEAKHLEMDATKYLVLPCATLMESLASQPQEFKTDLKLHIPRTVTCDQHISYSECNI